MDIKVVADRPRPDQRLHPAGAQLVGDKAATLMFDAKGSLSATSLWNLDPTKRSTGTILLDSGSGPATDMIAGDMFGSGKIAALVEMRDHVLVEAQAQVDQIASAMSRALSDRTTAGTAVRSARRPGSTSISDRCSPATASISPTRKRRPARSAPSRSIRVDDPSVLPLPADRDAECRRQVVGLDFSGGMASVIAQINSALGPSALQFSNPAGTTLRVLDDGAGGKVDANALSATTTMTSLTERQRPSCRSSSTARSPSPARSRRSATRASDLRAASR